MCPGIHHSLDWSFGMSIPISCNTTHSDWTIADYLVDWSAYFGDVNHRLGQVVDDSNTDGFSPDPFDGS